MGTTYFLDSSAATERQIFQYDTLQGCRELNLTKCMDQELDSSDAERDQGQLESRAVTSYSNRQADTSDSGLFLWSHGLHDTL